MQLLFMYCFRFSVNFNPYSFILGKVFLKKDIRDYGDGNREQQMPEGRRPVLVGFGLWMF